MSTRRPLRLTLTADQEHHLYEAVNNARKSTKFVKVDKDALFALLVDHGRALAALPDGYEDENGRLGP